MEVPVLVLLSRACIMPRSDFVPVHNVTVLSVRCCVCATWWCLQFAAKAPCSFVFLCKELSQMHCGDVLEGHMPYVDILSK